MSRLTALVPARQTESSLAETRPLLVPTPDLPGEAHPRADARPGVDPHPRADVRAGGDTEAGSVEVPLAGNSEPLTSPAAPPRTPAEPSATPAAPDSSAATSVPTAHASRPSPDPVVSRQTLPIPPADQAADLAPQARAGADLVVPLAGEAGPITRLPVQRLSGPGQPVEGPLTTGGTRVQVGTPVRSWPVADPQAGGDGTGLRAVRTLVPLHRMFASAPEALPTEALPTEALPTEAVPRAGDHAARVSPGIPAHRPRLGVGLPLPGPAGQPHPDAGTTWAPVQRNTHALAPRRGAPGPVFTAPGVASPGEPSPPAPLDQGSGTSGFTEVLLQRAEVPDTPAEVPGGGAGPGPSAVPHPATGDPAAALPSGRALDELVERLYEPLTARLKTELWLDRERSGLMVNLRR